MPAYDYECPNGHAFEIVSSIEEHTSSPSCPECQAIAGQVFNIAPKIAKINTQEKLVEALQKRSSDDSKAQAPKNVERLLAGEKGGHSIYSREAQEAALRTRGVKMK